MRFANLLTLLAATSALAYNIKRDEFDDEAQKLGQLFDSVDYNDIENAANDFAGKVNSIPNAADAMPDVTGVTTTGATTTGADENAAPDADGLQEIASEECSKITADIYKCIGEASKSTSDDEACNKFNSPDCQAVLKQDYSACSDFGKLYGATLASLRLTCGKDEGGNYCPIAKLQQSKKDITDGDIEETCKSKACSDQALEGFKQIKEATEAFSGLVGANAQELNVYDKYINALNEEKCVAAHSGATQMKVGSALLATLALVLYLF